MSAMPSYASLAEPALRPKMSIGVHIREPNSIGGSK